MKKYSDIISGAVLFVLAAVYYVMATQIKQYNAGLPGTITSDFIPKVYVVLFLALTHYPDPVILKVNIIKV